MDAASLNEVRKELQLLSPARLAELCISLARYKKDNKEYLSFLLFDAHNKQDFLNSVKSRVEAEFVVLGPGSNLYHAKKSLRRILRTINKYAKYLNDKALAAELHIHFLQQLRGCGLPFKKSQLLLNLYAQELKKINTLIGGLHEDLQSDYHREAEALKI